MGKRTTYKVGDTIWAGTDDEAIILEIFFSNGLPCDDHHDTKCPECHHWWHIVEFKCGYREHYTYEDLEYNNA